MFELIILVIALIVFGYFNYRSSASRGKSLMEKLLGQENKKGNSK